MPDLESEPESDAFPQAPEDSDSEQFSFMSSGLHVESAQVHFPPKVSGLIASMGSSNALPNQSSDCLSELSSAPLIISKDHLALAPTSLLDETSGKQEERCLSNQDVRHDSSVGKSKQVPVFDGPVAANHCQQSPGEKSGIDWLGATSEADEAKPISPLIGQPMRNQQIQTEQNEASATDSEKSEPCLTLIETIKGLQHELQILSKGFKQMVRAKKWAEKGS
jgi:hypothetical protein